MAIISYTCEGFQPATPRILRENVRHRVQNAKCRIDPLLNETTYEYDGLERRMPRSEAACRASIDRDTISCFAAFLKEILHESAGDCL